MKEHRGADHSYEECGAGSITEKDGTDGRLKGFSPWVVDVALSVCLTAAVASAIAVAPEQGEPLTPTAFVLAPVIGALALLRRRWPLATLLASAVALQVYNAFDNPGIFAAVPLSVTLATAWAAGYRVWSLALAIWFAGSPLVFVLVSDLPEETASDIVNGAVSDVALMASVLLLGEAVRGRRALRREHELLRAEQSRSEALLLNVLPASIADRLREQPKVIADEFEEVTVMFADLVDFTRNSQGVGPDEVVSALNELFSSFDSLTRRHGLEKFKTIGDAYMVAGGLPEPRPDHAEAVAAMALDLLEEVATMVDGRGGALAVRIGIDTGPVVAGVIGRDKFSYDLWGDTVNTASRMESHGLPGHIQVTDRTYQLLRYRFLFQRRGTIEVKGKGKMVTWFLLGDRRSE